MKCDLYCFGSGSIVVGDTMTIISNNQLQNKLPLTSQNSFELLILEIEYRQLSWLIGGSLWRQWWWASALWRRPVVGVWVGWALRINRSIKWWLGLNSDLILSLGLVETTIVASGGGGWLWWLVVGSDGGWWMRVRRLRSYGRGSWANKDWISGDGLVQIGRNSKIWGLAMLATMLSVGCWRGWNCGAGLGQPL